MEDRCLLELVSLNASMLYSAPRNTRRIVNRVCAAICGWLADFTSSRRLPFLLGLAALASATLLLCIGYNIQMLMVARVIQGFSGALMWITGLALLVDTVGREGIGQATSLADIGVTTGTVLAPTLGGLLYENAGYYSVFAISFAILAVDVFLRLVLIEKKAANAWLLAESSRREYGTIKSNSPDDGHRSNGFSSAVQKGGQSNDEGQDPLIDPGSDPEARLRSWDWIVPKTPTTLKVLKSSRIQAALYGLLVQSVVLCSLEAVLPIFLNETFGWRAQGGGLTLLAIAIPSVFAPVVGYLSDRYSPRWITGSLFMIAVPALVLLRFVQKPSMGDISLLLVSLVVLGTFPTTFKRNICFLFTLFSVFPLFPPWIFSLDKKILAGCSFAR